MEFPIEIQMLINAYAKPMTRPDWREGSYLKRTLMSGCSKYQRASTAYYNFECHIEHGMGLLRNMSDMGLRVRRVVYY